MADVTQAATAACKFCGAANEGVALDADAFRCGNCGAENLTEAGKSRRAQFATEGGPDVVQGKTTFGGTTPEAAPPAEAPAAEPATVQPEAPTTPAGAEEPQVS